MLDSAGTEQQPVLTNDPGQGVCPAMIARLFQARRDPHFADPGTRFEHHAGPQRQITRTRPEHSSE